MTARFVPSRKIDLVDGYAVYNVANYGADPTGVSDSTTAFNNCIAAALAAGVSGAKAKVVAQPGDYAISGQVLAQPTDDLFSPVMFSGWGARLHLTSATAGMVFMPGAGKRWRYGCFEGFMALIDSNAVTDAFLFQDSSTSTTSSENFWAWTARGLVCQTGTATAPINNGIRVLNRSNINVMFQYAIRDCTFVEATNVTGCGIVCEWTGAGSISSCRIENPNTYGGLNGVRLGSSGKPITGGHVLGGTCVGAYEENVKLYIQGGGTDHTHVEGAWGRAPSGSSEGGEVSLTGNGSIIELDPHLNTATNGTSGSNVAGQATAAAVIYATGGDVNLIGRRVQALAITGAADNGSGLIRITATAHGFATGDRVSIWDMKQTFEANGLWTVTRIDANTFDLQGSGFVHTYSSGGFCSRPFARILDTNPTTTGTVNAFGIRTPVIDTAALAAGAGNGSPTVNLGYGGLTPTAVKTGAYTLNPGELALGDATSAGINFKLPIAPADGTVCGLKMVATASGHTCALNTQASDVFDVSGGSTSRTLSVLNQIVVCQYDATYAIWYCLTHALPATTTLDQITVPAANVAMNSKKFTGLAAGSAAGESIRYEQVFASTFLASLFPWIVDFQYFTPTASATWNKPNSGTMAFILAVGAGGGGGGGTRGASSIYGGAGGGSGTRSAVWLPMAALAASYTVQVGAGGAGGAGASTGTASTGADGSRATIFDTSGVIVSVPVGTGGAGGGTSSPAAGTGGGAATTNAPSGYVMSVSTTTGGNGGGSSITTVGSNGAGGGGGGASGITSGAASSGNGGTGSIENAITAVAAGAGTVGNVAGVGGGFYGFPTTAFAAMGGAGGGSSGGSTAGTGGFGMFGGGGGGSGSRVNAGTAPNGGNGGDGALIVVVF